MKEAPHLGQLVYDGVLFNVYQRMVRERDGRERVHELASCPDVVRVYPIDREGSVILIDEHRYERGDRVLRTVAGRIERGRTPEGAAGQELAEELGLQAGRWVKLGESRPVLKIEHVVHHFAAYDLRTLEAHPEPGEDIVPRRVPLEALEAMVWNGEVLEDVIALCLLRLARQQP